MAEIHHTNSPPFLSNIHNDKHKDDITYNEQSSLLRGIRATQGIATRKNHHQSPYLLRYIVTLLLVLNLVLISYLLLANGSESTSTTVVVTAATSTQQNNNMIDVDAAVLQSSSNIGKEESSVGDDRDSHGCIPSAGFMWCEELRKCVRLWETPCP